jgi:hypothetical protein
MPIFHGQRGCGQLGCDNPLKYPLTRSSTTARGRGIEPKNEARLSPLQHAHINILGRYQFAISDALMRAEYLSPERNGHYLSILTAETSVSSTGSDFQD